MGLDSWRVARRGVITFGMAARTDLPFGSRQPGWASTRDYTVVPNPAAFRTGGARLPVLQPWHLSSPRSRESEATASEILSYLLDFVKASNYTPLLLRGTASWSIAAALVLSHRVAAQWRSVLTP